MFADWYDPGYKAGGPIQACKNVVAVLKAQYDFYIICSDRDLGEKSPYQGIRVNEWQQHEQDVKILYASPDFISKKNLLHQVTTVGPDFVYFNSMYSLKYTLLPLYVLLHNPFKGKIILAPRGMLHKGALRQKFLKKYIFLWIFQLIGWSRRIIFQATDEQEVKDIRMFFSQKVKVILVEDIPTADPVPLQHRQKIPGELRCVFLSRIHPKKNLHYFLERLNTIDPSFQISLDIYGVEDHAGYSEQCKKYAASLPSNIKVQFFGALPFNQVFETLRRYHLFILPTLGENYGHAIFEAMSTGTPVLISDQTPWRNLKHQQIGWDIPLNHPHEFEQAIKYATSWNQAEFDQWSERTHHFSEEYMHSLEAFRKYMQLFTQNERKRILLFIDWYEPGFKAGGPIQSCRNIVNMLKDEFEFYIVCSDRDLGDKGPYKNMPLNEWVRPERNVNIWYASPSFITRDNISRIMGNTNPDYVYLNSMYSPRFTLLPLWTLFRERFAGKIILAPRGMLHKGALQRKYFKKYVFLRLFRFIGWHKRLLFHATDNQEFEDIRLFFTKEARIVIAENIPGTNQDQWKAKQKEPGELSCVFVSRIHPKKNLYYFLKVLSEIRDDVKLAFDVYGVEDDRGYAAHCRQMRSELNGNIRVGFKGPLPHHKVFETMRDYHLFVLPTLGENFGHAIFEALSAGDPVLISDQTPWRGLEKLKAGWDIPLQKSEKFKEAIKQAVAWNQDEYNEWSRNAFNFAKNRMDINKLFEKYSQLFE